MHVATRVTPAPLSAAKRPVVLVTGGSRGIGLALAQGFAARGHELVLVARGHQQLEEAAAAIRAEHGVRVTSLPRDLARPESVPSLLAAVDEAGCHVDILVNCAGVGAAGPFVTSPAAYNGAALALNVDAATRLMQACLPGMLERRRGGVLNVASLAGLLPMPYLAVYGASKSYFVALSRAVASEVGPAGVTVSVLLPGPVDTTFFSDSLHASDQSTGLLPALSAEAVAGVAIEGFAAGQRVITPGMLGSLSRLGLKLLPRGLLAAFIARALRPPADDIRTASLRGEAVAASSSVPPAQRRSLGSLLARQAHILVLLCVALLFLLQAAQGVRKVAGIGGDHGSYVAAAAALRQHGVFSSNFVVGAPTPPPPGRSLAPGYPAFIVLIALVDSRMGTVLACPAARWAECAPKTAFLALFVAQAVAGLAALSLVYLLARALSGSAGLAAGATALAYLIGGFTDFVGISVPYAILPALALGFCLALLMTHTRRSIGLAALSGLLLGALALTEAYYVALWPLAPLLLLAAERSRPRPDRRFAAAAGTALILAAGLLIGPCMARNYMLFGDVGLTDGIEAQHFAERVAYNGVRGRDLWVCLFFWFPGIGDLSSVLLPRAATVKFDVYYPGSLLLEAPRILAAAGAGGDGLLTSLFRMYVIGDPGGYVVSTLLLIERGLGVSGGLFVLWGWLTLPVLLRRLWAQRSLGPFMLVAGPLLGMVVVQALLTANLPWMNRAVVFIYAYAILRVTGGLELPLWLRRHLSPRHPAGGAPA